MREYVPQIIATLIAIFMILGTKMLITKLVTKYGNRIHKSEMRMTHMNRVISILLNITFVIIMLFIWGVEPQNLLIGLSSIFAVIGVAMFAQWSILSNITAGIILFFSAPFRIGDRIQILDKEVTLVARIENIQTFYTHIRSDNDELIVLPNNLFLQKTVVIIKDDQSDSIAPL